MLQRGTSGLRTAIKGSQWDGRLEAWIGAELVVDGQNVALGKGKAGLELADLGVKEVLVLIHDWFDLFYADAHDQILCL